MKIVSLRLKVGFAFLLIDARPVLIDTGSPGEATRIRTLLAQEGVGLADLSLILHTHAHWDHCGSTKQLKEWTRAPAAVHPADAEMMRRGDNGGLKPAGLAGLVLKPLLDKPYPGVQADVLVEEDTDLRSYGLAGRVITTPGHTAGSISVLTAAGDAFVGDLFMGGYWGGTLLPSRPTYHYYADDFIQLRASIRKLLSLSPRRIYPGHGGPLEPTRVARAFGL